MAASLGSDSRILLRATGQSPFPLHPLQKTNQTKINQSTSGGGGGSFAWLLDEPGLPEVS